MKGHLQCRDTFAWIQECPQKRGTTVLLLDIWNKNCCSSLWMFSMISQILDEPLTSATPSSPTSATKRRFFYRQLPDVSESAADSRHTAVTVVILCSKMSPECTSFGSNTVIVRPVECLLCLLQTYCSSCDSVLNITYSSDRRGGLTFGNYSLSCDSMCHLCHHGHGRGSCWPREAGTSYRYDCVHW